jgi:hypothetical protein
MKVVKILSFSSAAALIFGAATAWGAGTDSQRDISQSTSSNTLPTITNPCTGAPLTFSGNAHYKQQIDNRNVTYTMDYRDIVATDTRTNAKYRTQAVFGHTNTISSFPSLQSYQGQFVWNGQGETISYPANILVMYNSEGATILNHINQAISSGICNKQS